MPNFTLRMFFGPILLNRTLKVHSMPLLIESVVSAALSRVAVMPDGVTFAEVSPDICFRLNPHRHCGIVLLPPMGFAIVTTVVCMLAAREWGQLSGFTSTSQRVWLAVLCGLLLAAMLFLLPEYHYDVHQPMVEGSLWASFARWIVALLLVLSYPASAAFWRHSKVLRLIFGILTIVPFFWGMLALRARHYADNHYSGALWLLYVMIRCGARTLAPICLVKCLASTSWRRRSHRVKRQGFLAVC